MIRIAKGSIALAGLLALSAMAVALPARAQYDTVSGAPATASIHASGCPQWTLGGTWYLAYDEQPDHGSWGLNLATTSLPPKLELQQAGTRITGSISFPEAFSQTPVATGSVIGTLSGDAFEFTATWRYTKNSNWNFEQTTILAGQITRDGVVSGILYPKVQGPAQAANWHSDRVATCKSGVSDRYDSRRDHDAALVAPSLHRGVGFGRVGVRDTTTPRPPICDLARSAKARNSPAAPGLERQCLASGGSMTPPPPPPPPPLPPAPPPLDAVPDLDALVAVGAAIAAQDPAVEQGRNAEVNAFYQLGFDIASGLFGDPALGSAGNTVVGPGAQSIRNSLSRAGQRGFDASVALHLARDYRH